MDDRERVLAWIDENRDRILEFALEFAAIESPRGYEREASEALADWFVDHEFDVSRQQVVGDRENVVGRLPGTAPGDGESLLFNAHLDTAHGNSAEDRWVVPESHPAFDSAWRDGDYLIGDSVVNDKGPLAAALWGVYALDQTDVDLAADVSVTGTVGEICGATVDEYRDYERLAGPGVGTRRLVDGGVVPDHAVVVEATDFALAHVECGLAWFKITTTGTSRYQPLVALEDGDDVTADHPGALPDAARAVTALEEWAVRYREENTVEYDHGTMRPTAGVGAIRSGNPFMPAKSPGIGAVYLDVRLPPETGPEFVEADIERALADADVDATVETYLFRRGYAVDTETVEWLRSSLAGAHEHVRGESTPHPRPAVTSMWRDFNVFAEVGVPAVMFGPPRTTPESWDVDFDPHPNSALQVDDVIDATKIYALTALETCTP